MATAEKIEVAVDDTAADEQVDQSTQFADANSAVGVRIHSLEADGSLAEAESADDADTETATAEDMDAEQRAVCPTCDGSGKIMGGNRKCPDCDGTGKRSADEPRLNTRRKRERHRAVPLMPEVRHFTTNDLEIRDMGGSGDAVEIVGVPIVYNVPYVVCDLFGEFEERMLPGVASRVLAGTPDVRLLVNHDSSKLLARTTSGTLRLSDTAIGVEMAATLDLRDSDAQNLMVRLERRDLTQMSCGFVVGRDIWDDAFEHREITELADLLDVSAVTYPASPTTSIEVARRMAFAMPIESQARMRQMYVDMRAGKPLSGANADKLVTAFHSIHSVLGSAGIDPLGGEPDADDQDNLGVPDGEPELVSEDDGTIGGGSATSEGTNVGGASLADGTGGALAEPGEPIRSGKPAKTLRLHLEAAKRRRISADE